MVTLPDSASEPATATATPTSELISGVIAGSTARIINTSTTSATATPATSMPPRPPMSKARPLE